MTEQPTPPPVTDDEWLARFIMYAKWIRADRTVRPDAFIPHPWPDLSVMRHVGLAEAELWRIGRDVADKRSLPLHGRADIRAPGDPKTPFGYLPLDGAEKSRKYNGLAERKARAEDHRPRDCSGGNLHDHTLNRRSLKAKTRSGIRTEAEVYAQTR